MSNLIKKIKTWQWFLGIITISLIIFFPAFKTFFTNDDFFLLKISKAENIQEFVSFFNLTKGPDGLGMYRPLTTQVFYSLSWKFFNLNPIRLHILSFLTFAGVIYSVYKLIDVLLKNKKLALLSAFLYATSATHFGHLYYLATYQELGMTLFVLLSCLFFLKYLNGQKLGNWFLSFSFFVLGLLSKETAVMTPFLIILLYLFVRFQKHCRLGVKKFALLLIPYFLILAIYFFFRFSSYGFATGDSYVWNFSPIKALNTLFWYKVWSLNLPETLVDFVGPGFRLNPNLLKYWSKEIIPIFVLFGAQVLLLICAFIRAVTNKRTNLKLLLINLLFGFGWFVLSITPVLFLPIHKFTFYLTLPLVGFVFALTYLLTISKNSRWLVIIFGCIWLVGSFLTLKLTYETNWITRGAQTSKRVYAYFKENYLRYEGKTILFYDTSEDKDLPFSPTLTLKNTLSDDNFFKVFFSGKISALYEKGSGNEHAEKIKSRQFLGY